MYLYLVIPVLRDFWCQYLPDPDTNMNTCIHLIYYTMYIGFVTAVNEL